MHAAGAMWTNLLPSLLQKHLPTTPQATIDQVRNMAITHIERQLLIVFQIFGDITNLPAFGTAVRDGMVAAYMYVQSSSAPMKEVVVLTQGVGIS